jgi:hypothetical protein
MKSKQLQLGDKVKDKITGFEGIATSRTVYINGCVRIGIQPVKLSKEGKTQEADYFDEGQIEIIKAGVIPVEPELFPTGGPQLAPRNQRNPR